MCTCNDVVKSSSGSDQITITITVGPEYYRGLAKLLADLPKVLPGFLADMQKCMEEVMK